MIPDYEDKVDRFAQLVDQQQKDRIRASYPNLDPEARYEEGVTGADTPVYGVTVTHAKKYSRVDVGSSGKYMVEKATGAIFGIKGYGVIHRGHYFGTLDEVDQWDWSGHAGRKRVTA